MNGAINIFAVAACSKLASCFEDKFDEEGYGNDECCFFKVSQDCNGCKCCAEKVGKRVSREDLCRVFIVKVKANKCCYNNECKECSNISFVHICIESKHT